MEDDGINKAEAEALAQDYDEIGLNDEPAFCSKYKTFCHIVGALLLSVVVVMVITFGILYFG